MTCVVTSVPAGRVCQTLPHGCPTGSKSVEAALVTGPCQHVTAIRKRRKFTKLSLSEGWPTAAAQ